MRRLGFKRLRAGLVSLQRAVARHRSDAEGVADAAASPLLVFVAIALCLILAILEIELHRDQLKALGLLSGRDWGPIPAGP